MPQAGRGVESLLVSRKKSGRPQAISNLALTGLKERLKQPDNGFKSYGAMEKWIRSEYGEKIDYKTLHCRVRDRLKAKLKVPRRASIKKDVEQVENFKKN